MDANINLTDQMFGGSGATQTVTTLLGAEERQKMGFSLEDLVSGDLPVEIVSGRDEQGRETNDVTLDLTPVRMSYPAIGLDKPPGALGGGEGEEQFGSFLVREQARAMARAGGIGLAETIYQAMRKRADG